MSTFQLGIANPTDANWSGEYCVLLMDEEQVVAQLATSNLR